MPTKWSASLVQHRERVYHLVSTDAQSSSLNPAAEEQAAPDSLHDEAIAAFEKQALNSAQVHWLMVPSQQVLRPRLTMPAGATERLREMLSFEIERQTPFRAEQVVFDYRVVECDGEEPQVSPGMMRIEMVVLPKLAFEKLLAASPVAQLEGMDVQGSDLRPVGVNLMPKDLRYQYRNPMRNINLVLLAVTLLSVIALLLGSIENRQEAADTLRARIKVQSQAAAAAVALRAELIAAVKRANFFSDTLTSKPPMVAMLADLTHRLPDGTWLERIAVNEGRVTLGVVSDQTSTLVKRLEDSPWLRAAALNGAIQNDPASGRDRSTITADLVASADNESKPSTRARADSASSAPGRKP